MVRYLTERQRAAVYALFLTPGISNNEIATSQGCSQRTVQRLRRTFELEGKLYIPPRTPQNSTKLPPFAVQELVEHLWNKPDLYLDEMQWFLALEHEIFVSQSTISRALRAEGWTKKKQRLRPAQQNLELRDEWIYKTCNIPANCFVFCDESGLDKRDGARRTGWAPLGLTPESSSMLTRGKRFHLLPAITVDGLFDLLVYEGHTDKVGFAAWLTERILPRMGRYPEPNSILVMDNASWHRDPIVRELCDAAGVKLWYLPPYSPEFNPIEAYFGQLKHYIRRQYKYSSGDDFENGAFQEWLRECAEHVGSDVEAIRGHFRKSGYRIGL